MTSTPPGSSPNPLYDAFLSGATERPVNKWHHYFDIYHQHFAPYRGTAPTVLEIGVQNGGSLELWLDYFGAGARVFGADIDPACKANAPPGATVLIGDQADPAFLKRVLDETGPPDIVIDDGGHTTSQMIASFEALYPAMKLPGVYVVEDTHALFWGGRYLDHPSGKSFYQHAFGTVRALHDWTRDPNNFRRLMVPPEERAEVLPASAICKTTTSVCFYDSVIVFTRQHRPEPWNDHRGGPAALAPR